MRLQVNWSFYILSWLYLICQTYGYYFDYLSPTHYESESNNSNESNDSNESIDSNESNEGLVSDEEYRGPSTVVTIDAEGMNIT